MVCNEVLNSKWIVGKSFGAYNKKKFVKFAKVIPKLSVDIEFGDCDIEGWTIRAYFLPPDYNQTDVSYYEDEIISNGNVEFDLEGSLLSQYGTWNIQLVLIGLSGESTGTTNNITYEIISNVEGNESPVIPPEETQNTVSELIEQLDETIEEGNEAEVVWSQTISDGNLDNSIWLQTISDGNDANDTLVQTISDSNNADDTLQQSITEGTALSQQIEDQINNGDVLQKGTGYDESNYPYAVDITNDLEQKTYMLDERLVYGFIPSKRNLENLNYGVYIKNPLMNGDGTIKSEDSNSLAGVFNDENGSFYCGEGYENLADSYDWSATSRVTIIEETLEYIKFIPLVSNSNGMFEYRKFITVDSIAVNESITFNVYDNSIEIGHNGGGKPAGRNLGSITYVNDTGSAQNLLNFDVKATDLTIGKEYTIKKSITKTSQPVPSVKDTAPSGKVIIKEPWTSETHSFIGVGFTTKEDVDSRIIPLVFGGGVEERVRYGDNVVGSNNGEIDFIFSNIFNLGISENNGELNSDIISKGVYGGFIRLTFEQSQATRTNKLKGFFVYEGNLTEAELRSELEKIKSGKYYVENTGVYEPVPGAKKRANEYGRMKDYVYVSSNSTDIQLVETNKIVITEINGVRKRDVIDGAGAITGDGGIVDVNGYIRLATNVKTKVVIEVE